jgi:hypothetical protein
MPIDQTIRGLALQIDASTDPSPESQPLLEYRFIDLASTQTILARIKGIPHPNGGGELAFETNAGTAATTQRMLIDNKGNVGIATDNPGARLDVAGDAKFSGPLSVQGALRVDGFAQIGGDLSVTGKLTAASFAGNGAGLSNLTPADNSVTNAKLAQDPASLFKVTGGKMIISANNVGIGTTSNPQNRLHVGPGTSSIVPSRVNAVVASNAPDAGIAIAQNSGVNVLLQASGAGGYLGTTSNHPLVFRTGDQDRMVVDTNGNVSVRGLTKTGKLQLGNKWLLSGEGDAHGNDDWLRLFNIQNTGYFGGFAAGRLWSLGGTVYGSDRRLKTDVTSLDHMADKVLALRAVRFKWRNRREEDSYRIGLIAQEVESVLPEVIETGPDGMKGINEAGLVAAIITVIKEQQNELRALRAEFARFRAGDKKERERFAGPADAC